MAEPFATPDDLAAFWRPLSASERDRAEALLGYASAMVRSRCHGEPGDAGIARYVACDMVKTAMAAGDATAPVTQATASAGGYSSTLTFANPTGDLYWKRQYGQLLGLSGTGLGCVMPAIGGGGHD